MLLGISTVLVVAITRATRCASAPTMKLAPGVGLQGWLLAGRSAARLGTAAASRPIGSQTPLF